MFSKILKTICTQGISPGPRQKYSFIIMSLQTDFLKKLWILVFWKMVKYFCKQPKQKSLCSGLTNKIVVGREKKWLDVWHKHTIEAPPLFWNFGLCFVDSIWLKFLSQIVVLNRYEKLEQEQKGLQMKVYEKKFWSVCCVICLFCVFFQASGFLLKDDVEDNQKA